MSPGPLTNAHRGGSLYAQPHTGHRAAGGFYGTRVHSQPPQRNFSAPRGKFSITTGDDGQHIVLDDGERAEIVANPDGSITISVENKPAVNGGDVTIPVEEARRGFIGRLAHGVLGKMSWVKEPGGEIVITPDEGETLFVTGDAVQAVVTAQPTAPG